MKQQEREGEVCYFLWARARLNVCLLFDNLTTFTVTNLLISSIRSYTLKKDTIRSFPFSFARF